MFKGSFVALVTPMAADGSIEWDRLDELVDWHVESGTHGIVAVGTTGESPTLSMVEHLEVVARTVARAAGRTVVIAGTGANSTAEAIELTKGAAAAGADACLSVVPYYNKPPQHGLKGHFGAIADEASVPVILYNVPSRTVVDLADDTLAELAQHPRIVGVKDATGDLDRLKAQQEMIADPEFSYLSGDDATACAYVLAGGHGVISVTANVAPQQTAKLVASALANDRDAALAEDAKLQPFCAAQGVEANPIPVKWALGATGRIGPGIRSPLAPLSKQLRPQVEAAAAGLS